jgi:hypothetical protein
MLKHILRQLSAAGLILFLLIGMWLSVPSEAQAVSMSDFWQNRIVVLADVGTMTEEKPPIVESAKTSISKASEKTEAVAKEVTKTAKDEAKKTEKLAKAEAKKAKKLAKTQAKEAKKLAKAEAKKAKELAKAEAKKAKLTEKSAVKIESKS